MKSRLLVLSVVLVAALSLSACGGGSMGSTGGKIGNQDPPPPTYTIGGTIAGLTASGLVLQNNGANNLTVSANQTSFAFSDPIDSASKYDVTISAQPSGETCAVTNGTGTADANVTNIAVSCTVDAPSTYTVGGTISGLSGTGLQLQNSGVTKTIAAGSKSFSFTGITKGSKYDVTVLTQPKNPTETCTVTNGSGTANGNVNNIVVACSTVTYTVSGTISGLTGTGLQLQNDGTTDTIAAGATSFKFTGVPSGSTYDVTVLTQPTNPAQTCTVTNGSGTANGNVTNVAVTCSTTTYTIGGTISGLTGTGLVLQDNGTSNLTIAAGATSFTFATKIPSGGAYDVTVFTQPRNPTQTCTVANGSGTASGNVTNVAITCSTTTYTIGGTISGLTGTGLVLQDNGTSNLTIAAGATSFTFATKIPSGGAYAVTVFTQPTNPTQTCTVANGSGTATGNVTNVAITCSTATYTIGGTISGLTGTGLVLQDNGTSNLTIAAGATTFTFSTQIPSGGAYAVTVFTQPTNPTQTCTVANGSGTATGNVTNVAITCSTTTYTIGGTISGLTGTGLVLQDNGTSNLTIAAGATTFTFTTQIPSGGAYAVTVFTQPTNPTQTCTVANGSGTANANVTNVAVTCATTTYTIGGTITGLTGTGLVLQDNGTSNLSIAAGATTFTFSTQIPSGGAYAVTVFTQPTNPTQTCTVANGSGTATGNVTNVAVTCATTTYTIGGTISGLTGTGLVLQDNGTSNLSIAAGATTFTFSTQIPSGGAYAVTVFTQPTNPTQTCTVANGSGTATGNVTNVAVTCATTTYTIGGTISGLTGTGLVLQDNGTSNLSIAAGATSFTFSAQIPSGGAYAVTVFTQPTNPTQTCTVANGSGTATGNVTNVAVTCATTTYTIGGTITGLTGTGLVLQDNGTSNLTIAAGATTFTFSTQIPSGGAYAVTVFTQPTNPTQTCTVANGSGTATGNVTNVAVTCATTTYTIGGTITGLTGTGLVLQDNGTSNLSIAAGATSFTFSAQIPSGGAYAVTVFTQPTNPTQTCTVANGSGTATGNVTNVAVTCATTTYTIGGTITGLTGTGLVLQDNGTSNLTIAAGATSFTFSTQIPSGGAYAVTVFTQPTNPTQTCTVANGSGTATGNVTNVAVTCATTTYTIGGTISGLTGTGLVLQDNGTSNLTIAAGATTFTFSAQIPSGGAYAVTVFTQPTNPTQTCTVANGSGTATGNVTNVAVTCATTTYTIGGTISGLTGTGLVLQDNGTSNLSIAAGATTFTFTTQIPAGGIYNVTVLTQPTNPTQTCTVTNGSGTANANVTNVAVACSTSTTFTIGGTIAGLTGSGLVLQDNATNNLTITSGQTSFTFTTQIPAGSPYSVTVFTQPTNPSQTCSVTDGSGTANANVTNVLVACNNQWTWQNGADSANQNGNYGTRTKFATTNVPGARYGAVTWTDNNGNLWLFGGNGIAGNIESYLNDIWEWNGTEWAYQNGSNNTDQIGVYGTLGVAAGSNIPGARIGAVGWKDSAGNLWLFGGYGFDGTVGDAPGPLNDLWKFSIGANEWTYEGGLETINGVGVYGTQGTGNSTNVPGSRYYASASTDASGNFWLFGGEGFDSQGNQGSLNDLWEYSTTLSQWTWISGSSTQGQVPNYGTQGSGSSSTVPGARQGLVSWIDSSGNFWLFGGLGIGSVVDSTAIYGALNDTWEYMPSTQEWVWQGPLGSNSGPDQPSNYVAIGQAGTPGGRNWPTGWLDTHGNFWLFGGQEAGDGDGLNDLWLYSNGNWTWESGSSSPNQLGNYPSAFGITGPNYAPGARWNMASWLDKNNNLWLLGGSGIADAYPPGVLNDLWEFQP